MTLRNTANLYFLAVLLLACAAFSAFFYLHERQHLLESFDRRLYSAAVMLKETLPPDYHQRVRDAGSVPPETYEAVVRRNNRLCRELGLQYLWSCVKIGDRIRFTTATSPSHDIRHADHAGYFEAHNDPQAFEAVFRTMRTTYASFHNEWGHGRMVLVPFRAEETGHPYVFGASMSLSDVDAALGAHLRYSLGLTAGILILGFVVSLLFARSLAAPVHELTGSARRLADGHLDAPVRAAGCAEVVALGQALDRMRDALRGRIAELAESRENLRITLQSIGDAVITTDAEGRVRQMNPVAVALTGWTRDEAAGRPLETVFHIISAEDRTAVEAPSVRVLRDGCVVGLANHTLLVSRDGTERQIADSGAPIRDAEGTIRGVVIVFRDVTEQYALEEQIQHARKMDSIGQLAGGIAHDFNNMLGGIIGSADLLRSRVEGQPRLEPLVDTILEAGQRAEDLVGKLLAFARKGRGETKPVRVHESIRNAVGILERSVDRRIEIQTDLAADRCTIAGDPSQIQNIFLNLGINARDAMPEGGVLRFETTTVSLDGDARAASLDLAPGEYLRVRVSDTGEGVDEADRQRIFEPFYTTKREAKSTGLGLSAAYGTVKEHGGAISLQSPPGEGAAFEILLPLAAEEIRPATRPEPDETRSGGGTVLLVDDEPTVRQMGRQLLESLGYAVFAAASGQEAEEVYQRHGEEIDLVILDLVMPHQSGRECFAALQEQDPAVRVLLSSGFPRDEEIDTIIDQGAVGFVKKPYRRAQLDEAVTAALGAATT
jgi:PAS domain S-box-containing protein